MPRSEPAAPGPPAVPACDLPSLLIIGDPDGMHIAREALVELELGWDVTFARSASEALDVPAVRHIDVILIDLGNPHLDGAELTEALHSRFPHVPVILMSAPYAVSDALECVRKGAANHFPRRLLDNEPGAVLETLRAAAHDHRRRRTMLARLDSQYFELTLGNDPDEVPAIAGGLADAAARGGLCDRSTATRIAVAIEECLLNSIIHGNLEVSSALRQPDESAYYQAIAARRTQAPYAGRRVKVTATISPTEAAYIVQDEGPGFDVERVPDRTAPEDQFRGGRGILLMRSFMTSVHFGDGGRRVTMVRRRG